MDVSKQLLRYEEKVLAGLIKFLEIRYSWLNKIDETYFLNHESKMIYYVIENKKALSEHDLLIEIHNDGMKNNYNTESFIDFVEMEGIFCNDDFALNEIIRFKRYRELKVRFENINPFDPQENDIQCLYDAVSIESEQAEVLSDSQLLNFFGKEIQQQSDSIKPKFTGIKEFDEIVGGFVEGVTIISGRAGAGKTSKALQVLLEFSKHNQDLVTIFFSGEIGKRSMAHKIGAYYSKLDISRLKQHLFTESEFVRFCSKAQTEASKNAFFVETNGICVNEAEQIIKRVENETGKKVGLVCFDYLQLMKPNDKKTRSEAEEMSRVSGDLRELGKKIPVIAVSNLTKEKDSKDCPTAKELKGSSQIEYDASVIYMLWRPNEDQKNKICSCTVKNRFGEPFQKATWQFTGANGTFSFDKWGVEEQRVGNNSYKPF